MSPNRDLRLAADLEVLRVALGAYLSWLRDLWTGASSEVERLLGAAGGLPAVGDVDRQTLAAAVTAGRGDESGGLARLAVALDLPLGEELMASAAWWAELDPQLATVLGCAHDDGARRYASAALLRLVLEPFGIGTPAALEDDRPLVRLGVLQGGAGSNGPLRLTPTARHFLAGGKPVALDAPGPLPSRLGPLVARLAAHLSGSPTPVVIRGRPGGGRRALAVAGAFAAGRVPVAADRPAPELRLLARLAAAVPVAPVDGAGELGWRAGDGPLLMWAEPTDRCPQLPEAYTVDLPPPDPRERSDHWASALVQAGLGQVAANGLAAGLATRFTFTEGDIDGAVARARTEAAWQDREELDNDVVWAAARRQPAHDLARLADVVAPAFTLADLVLPDHVRGQLAALVSHVALQHVVLDRWGFRRRLPRGQGVAALFAGPPGTGKTMAAEALAHDLHQDLYRIDLSAVVSKYIGETEKNLAAAFGEAERAGAVLFFDEADALFGRRTEVRDAHDRYANLEVNYLLQRVESFTGLVILASNRKAAIDEAFLRRLRFLIRFELPDRELRSRLWQRSFPPAAPVARLDWDVLSRPELSGGSIQSVALHAAYQAASAGEAVGFSHVEVALRREYDKLGKAWPDLAPTPNGRTSTVGVR